jgi:hypothetical protein
MIAKLAKLAAAALATSLVAASAAGQTAADLLQKGIHAQETAGDADGAIQIYRQVVGSPGVTRAVAAQAQAHIVGALLQKGDLAGAGQEFGKLARDYADQEKLVTPMGERLRTIAENGPGLVLGSFQDGRYRHYWTGVEFAAPPGWSFTSQSTGQGGVDRADLADSRSKTTGAFVTFRRRDTAPAKIAGRLLERLQDKVTVMRAAPRGYIAYHLRPESVQRGTIAGQQAWSAVADYVNADGEKMNEYLTFVESERAEVFFSIFAAVPDFASVQALFEPVIQSARIP